MRIPNVIKAVVQSKRTKTSKQDTKRVELPPSKKYGQSSRLQRQERRLKHQQQQQQYEAVTDASETTAETTTETKEPQGRVERRGSKIYNRLQDQQSSKRIGVSTPPKQTADSRLNRFSRFCSKRIPEIIKYQRTEKVNDKTLQHEKDITLEKSRVNDEPSLKEEREQKQRLNAAPPGHDDAGSNGVEPTISSFEAIWLSGNGASRTAKNADVAIKNDDVPIESLFHHVEKNDSVRSKSRSRSQARGRKNIEDDAESKRRGARSLSRTPKKQNAEKLRNKSRSKSVPRVKSLQSSKQKKKRSESPRPTSLTTEKSAAIKKHRQTDSFPLDDKVQKRTVEEKQPKEKKGKKTKDIALEDSLETSNTEHTSSSSCPNDSSSSSKTRSRSRSHSVSRRSSSCRSSSRRRHSSRARSKSRARSSSRRRRSGRKMRVEDARKVLNPTNHPTYQIQPVDSSSDDDSSFEGRNDFGKDLNCTTTLKSPKRRTKRNPSRERGFSGLSLNEGQPRKGRRRNRNCQDSKTEAESTTTTADQSLVKKEMAQYPNPFVKPI